MSEDDRPHARARGLDTVKDRVAYIREMMLRLEWVRGVTGPDLAPIWGVAESTVNNYAAEASRQVIGDEDEAKRDITAGARKLFKQAVEQGNSKAAKEMGDLWATVSGAKAPEKREHTVKGVSLDDVDAMRKAAEANDDAGDEAGSGGTEEG